MLCAVHRRSTRCSLCRERGRESLELPDHCSGERGGGGLSGLGGGSWEHCDLGMGAVSTQLGAPSSVRSALGARGRRRGGDSSRGGGGRRLAGLRVVPLPHPAISRPALQSLRPVSGPSLPCVWRRGPGMTSEFRVPWRRRPAGEGRFLYSPCQRTSGISLACGLTRCWQKLQLPSRL